MSGGVLTDDQGKVVGVLSARDEETTLGSSVTAIIGTLERIANGEQGSLF